MDADNDRLESKLRGANVVDLQAARDAKERDTSMPFVDGVISTVTKNWLAFAVVIVFYVWMRRYAR